VDFKDFKNVKRHIGVTKWDTLHTMLRRKRIAQARLNRTAISATIAQRGMVSLLVFVEGTDIVAKKMEAEEDDEEEKENQRGMCCVERTPTIILIDKKKKKKVREEWKQGRVRRIMERKETKHGVIHSCFPISCIVC
jgi:hypothetical protein